MEKNIFKTLLPIIGSSIEIDLDRFQQKNREALIRALIFDKRMICSSCGVTYATEEDLDQKLVFEIRSDIYDPEQLLISLTCVARRAEVKGRAPGARCEHKGEYNFRPNPLL